MSRNGQLQPTIYDSVKPDALVRPVVAGAADYPAGHCIEPHRHLSGQLVYAAEGVMVVTTADGTWVVPPERAVWVPAGTEHGIRMRGPVAMRTLYIKPDVAPWLPTDCCVVAVPPLLRALILEAMTIEPAYPADGPEARLMAVILDRIRTLDVVPLHLPAARDQRLRRITDAIARVPGDDRTLAQWAASRSRRWRLISATTARARSSLCSGKHWARHPVGTTRRSFESLLPIPADPVQATIICDFRRSLSVYFSQSSSLECASRHASWIDCQRRNFAVPPGPLIPMAMGSGASWPGRWPSPGRSSGARPTSASKRAPPSLSPGRRSWPCSSEPIAMSAPQKMNG